MRGQYVEPYRPLMLLQQVEIALFHRIKTQGIEADSRFVRPGW